MIKIINFQRKNKEKQKKSEGFKEKKTKFTIFEEPGREK